MSQEVGEAFQRSSISLDDAVEERCQEQMTNGYFWRVHMIYQGEKYLASRLLDISRGFGGYQKLQQKVSCRGYAKRQAPDRLLRRWPHVSRLQNRCL